MIANELLEDLIKVKHWYKEYAFTINRDFFDTYFNYLVDFTAEHYNFDLIQFLDRVLENARILFPSDTKRPSATLSFLLWSTRYLYYTKKHTINKAQFLLKRYGSYQAKLMAFYYLVDRFFLPHELEIDVYKIIPYNFDAWHKHIFNRHLESNYYITYLESTKAYVDGKSYFSYLAIILRLDK